MGTSIGGAIDYLVTGTNPSTGTTLQAALAAVDTTSLLVDGIVFTPSQSLVVIGKADPESVTAQTGGQQVLVLGAGRQTEDYEIPCYAYATRPGPALKPARDAAQAQFDVVVHFVAADRTLGGLLQQGRVAQIGSVTLNQDLADDTGSAIITWISFTIHIQNHYLP